MRDAHFNFERVYTMKIALCNQNPDLSFHGVLMAHAPLKCHKQEHNGSMNGAIPLATQYRIISSHSNDRFSSPLRAQFSFFSKP
jgi:hypothetical protein